ncbi:MAG: hypothetical protein Q4F67_16530 [Propionibacteriaceae bacterium]|nr:hypothetical protein [Propionibacteriaceae bacterium]
MTLDAGPLIGLDRNNRKVIALIARAHETGQELFIPGTALAQAVRVPARQARLSRLLRQPRTSVMALDRVAAVAVGRLIAETGTRDITDAHVVTCALLTGTGVTTSDLTDLQRLAPELPLTIV